MSVRISRLSILSLTIAAAISGSVQAEVSKQDLEQIQVVGVKQPFRGDVSPKDLPQSVETLSAESIGNIAVTTLVDALSLSSSVAQQNDFGGLWDSFAIRGLVGDENVPSGYLINGYTSGRGFSGNRDVSNIERLEIMKGPGSALYGRSEPGGTLNIITKKPEFEQQGYVKLSAGSWQNYRTEGDFTNAINSDLAFRVNGAYEDNESFRNHVTAKKVVITPSLLWLISDKTKLNYELEYVNQEATFDRGLVAIDGDIEALPIETFLGEPSDKPTTVDVKAHQLTIEHDVNGWTLLGGISHKDSSFISESSDAELAPARQLLLTDGETLNRQHNERDFQTTDTSARIELSGTVKSAGLTHHLLSGADAYHFSFDKFWQRYRPGADDTTYSINVYNPFYAQEAPAGSVVKNESETQHAYGVYFQDLIDLSSQLHLLLGGRYDWFDQEIDNHQSGTSSKQDQSTFSPRVGIVYDYAENLQLYASYSQGFRPNAGSDVNGDAFDPETTKSFETGMKFNTSWVDGTVALFKAKKNNMLTTDLDAGVSVALGEVESEGVELELNGNITQSAQFNLSYTYTDAKTAKDMVNPDWWVALPKGSPLLNIPEHSASLTLNQDLSELVGANVNAGLNVQYVGDRLGETIDPTYILPAYTLVKLFAKYDVNDAISLQFNVNNALDKTYYANSYSALWTQPGAPRSVRLGVTYRFN